MSEVLDRLDQLSPERQALLQKILRSRTVKAAAPEAVRPRADAGPAPLSFAQWRLWLVDRLQPGSAAYNVPSAVRVRGPLDVSALERAVSEVARRHEVLRTCFPLVDGEPVQEVAPPAPVTAARLDVEGLPAGEREARARALAGEEALRPFDLEHGPLLRLLVIRLADDDHVVVLNLHHAVADGWSLGVLVRELSALYGASARGGEAALPELPVQYADYAVWQHERMRGEALEAELAWWRERLAGAPPLLELPTDRPRPSVAGSGGAGRGFVLSPATSGALRSLGRAHGATTFITLLAAWQLLLSRWSGQADVTVGTPVSGRTRGETEDLIGFFVNTLVLRADTGAAATFAELLLQVRDATLGAFQHQELPFDRLVEELAPERSLGHSPLFQAMFSFAGGGGGGGGGGEGKGGLELAGARVESFGWEGQAAKFDLTLVMGEEDGRITGSLVYRTELWDAATIDRLVAHFTELLDTVAAGPDRPLAALSFLPADEHARVVEEWNRTAADYPRHAGIPALFDAQARRTPAAVAVEFAGEALTYAELEARANRLASALLRRGVGPGGRVALSLERSAAMVVAMLATLKAGAAYVPLDPAYPAERLALMLEDSGARVLLTQASLADVVPAEGIEVIRLDADWEERVAPESPGSPHVEVGGGDPAYVIYTSGSTGRPKGVLIPHRAVARLVLNGDYVRLTADDRVAQASNASFDAATFEVWGALLNGGRLVGITRDEALSPASMVRVLRERKVTTLFLTTALFNGILAEDPTAFRTLTHLLFGGEAVDPRWVRAALEHGAPRRLLHVYGPTESTTFSTWYRIIEVGEGAGTVPIGRAIANTRAYVLDGRMLPVPAGVAGELYIGGDGLAHGYLNRPELTAEKFVPDPFSAGGGRLYRTGDRVRWTAEGQVEFLGRFDHQVKIRGFRIEPGEVEAALLAHPAVRETIVVVQGDTSHQRRLVAYAVAGEGEAVTPEGLRAHLKASLPGYMVPSAFVVMEALPLNANGKVDRAALPPADAGDVEAYVAPRTPTEEMMAGIWGEVLDAERVGVLDGFFALGGHSLLATAVIARVRAVFGVELPLRALFEHAVLEDFAAVVDEALRSGAGVGAVPPMLSRPRDGSPLRASFAQARVWFIDQLHPGTPVYNIPFALRVKGALDAAALERSLAALVRRHEVLRTTFAAGDNGEPVQVIHSTMPLALERADLSTLPAGERDGELERLATEEARRPFDLARGPLIRAVLLRLAEDEHALFVTVHHIASDGWSIEVMVREVSAFYEAYAGGREPQLPELPLQYADFAAWQRDWLQGEVLERQVVYWRERLAGAPPLLAIPTDRPRPAVSSSDAGSRPFQVSPGTARALRALARGEGATLFMTLLAAWQVLLSRLSGQTDVSVGTPMAGRDRLETEGLIGFFVNTLVLRSDLSAAPGFRELLAQVRETTLGAYAHQEVPFERLVEELAPERSLGHTPLFQAMFAIQHARADGGGLRLGGVRLKGLGTGRRTIKFDLVLTAVDDGGSLGGFLGYRTDLFEAATIDRILARFAVLLDAVVGDPDTPVDRLAILPEDERRLVVGDWNATPAAYDPRPVHLRFEAQAERTPDALAAASDVETLTYAELNARANRLAHRLRALGVGPEARVGLLTERSVETLTGILAVWKAGGAYVPVDPRYPAERCRLLLADAGAVVLLTQARLAADAPEGLPVIRLDADLASLRDESDADPGVEVRPESLAYVIYTSGSTGTPKGVLVEHRSLSNYLGWFVSTVLRNEPVDLPLVSSLSFDASMRQLFPPLLLGRAAWLLADDVVREPAALWKAAAARERVVFGCVPTLWSAMLDAVEAGAGHPAPGVEMVVLGGEALPQPLLERSKTMFPEIRVWNVYGATEATVNTSGAELDGDRVIIGRPVGNARVYLLDGAMSPVPVGVVGELYVAGAAVTRGYLGRPALTAQAFVPDPFSPVPGARMYRSGDRVRWNGAGRLEILGRADGQLKLRGFRVEPGEIEAALLRHPSVREAAVGMDDGRLAAWVAADGTPAAELREHLRRIVPEHMVPSLFVSMDALPRTPNGKLDRRALPSPTAGADGEDAHVPPRTPTEEILAGIWGEVLEVERVGAFDGFFEIGGHSLLATAVLARIRATFGVELKVRDIFAAPELAELALRIDAALAAGDVGAAPPLVRVAHDVPPPLSFAQQRLWFLDQLDPGSSAYNMAWSFRARGALDVGALERAFTELARRHESLRTSFPVVDGEPVQAIAPPRPVRLRVENLTALPDEERDQRLRELTRGELVRPFDLATGPLMRVVLARLADDDHAVLFTIHHIVNDGWSTTILVRELSALYEAFSRGEPSPLAERSAQYADYAAWQRAWLTGEVLERQVGYWRERLAGAPPLLELLTDRPRPAVAGGTSAVLPVRLPPELTAAFRALSRHEGVTLFMTLLAAWQTLLARWSGQGDVSVGTPIAGRTHVETEGMVGFFVNTLVLRSDLWAAASFRELLAQVRETTLGAYAHQEVPFDKLVDELAPERTMAHAPLFQVMFQLLNAGKGQRQLRLGDVRLESLPSEGDRQAFTDLSLDLVDEGDAGVEGSITYRTELFDASTITRMIDGFRVLLEAVAADPDASPLALPVLTGADRERLATFNPAPTPAPAGTRIHDLFLARAAEAPAAVALVHGGARVSYGELERRSADIARALRARGVGAETRVGVCLERTPELVAALLGVLRAGGTYVPLDPAYPAERLALMLEDSGARVVVTHSSLLDIVPRHAGETFFVDGGLPAEGDADGAVDAANGAYLIYTSGSTGRPKGVQIEHRSAVEMIEWARALYPAAELEGVLFSTSVCFDLSVYELFVPLAAGTKVILAENALALPTLAARDEVTLVNTVPSAMAELVRQGGVPASVRVVNLAGEPLPRSLADAIYGGTAVEKLYNLYGPSEDTTYSTGVLVPRDPSQPVTIGRAIANTRAWVVDGSGALAPVGVAGELCLAGAGLARGYLGRPALTAEKWVPDPFSGIPGSRMYRTGDLARWRESGEMEYLGRVDRQVKVRGFRIEPGEVEEALKRHAGMLEAAVIVREDVPGDRRLVGYVVAGQGAPSDSASIRASLRLHLPEHMVPGVVVVLDALPLTPSGKVDRKALPAPDATMEVARYVAPSTPTEEILAGIWAAVLKVERVGVHDSFFDLGGHSLLATRVISRIRATFVTELALRAIFEAPTLGALAARVDHEVRAGSGTAVPPLVRVPRDAPAPLSFAQQRLWFLDQLQPGSAAYNVPSALRVRGALDLDALRRSLDELARRHEVLRTVFPAVDGEPVQVIQPAGAFPLEMVDLSAFAVEEREAELTRLAEQEAARPFDLAAGPLARATVVRLGDEEHAVFFTLHHIVTDGWSTGILVDEVSALYDAYAAGRTPELADLPVQYADYAAWQRSWLAGEVLDAQVRWWREQLAGAPPVLELPTDRPRPAVIGNAGALRSFALPVELSHALRALSRAQGATLFMTLLAAWQSLLARWSGQPDVSVGTPIAGRTRLETEGLIGFFVNTLVLRSDVGAAASFRELLAQVRETTLGAHAHQDVPFEKLVEELAPDRSLAHTPLFQVLFTLQNAERGELRLGDVRLESLGGGGGHSAKFDLSLGMVEREDGIEGIISYRTELFDASTIERMIEGFRLLLEAVVADSDASPLALPILADEERSRVVDGFNATAREYPAGATLHGLVAAQAARTPDAIALVFEGETLTYAELDTRSNQLARHLRSLGVGAETRVGVCAERSPELVVALLGVIKAGGAYVPVDPSYPAERIAWMLEDSAVPVVLTQARLADTLPAHAARVVRLDADWAEIERESAEAVDVDADPSNLAYVIYTSGSTGRPKGVMVEHRSLVNHTAWQAAAFGIGARDTVLQRTSISFDASVWELWTPLATGARMLLLSSAAAKDPEAIGRVMAEGGVTVAQFVPTLLQAVLDARPGGAPLPCRVLFCGGEPLPAALVEEARAAGAGEVVNLYGPTEATIDSTSHMCGPDGRAPAIGRPIANARIYVLDARGEPAPVGVAGELYVGGAGVARGYLGRAGLTAERFVADPFSPGAGARMYRTGDLGRWRADGTLEFLGRTDFQVKVRGFRIELGEIEAALLAHPAVREAVATVREDVPGDRRLVGYVVAGQGAPSDSTSIRAALREHLPEHMVPGAIVVLEALPLSPNGKVDRKALPAPDATMEVARYVAPSTPTEEILAGIWAAVLKVERVGVHDSFFELGGHSLLATRVISRVRAAFATEIPLRAIFEAPTLGALAARVDHEVRAGSGTAVPPLVRVPRDAPAPLSFAQQRLWFLDQLQPGSAAYNVPSALRVRGALDVDALRRSLDELARRHEVLRTVFPAVDGEPVQVIQPAGAFPLEMVDLSAFAVEEREAELTRLAEQEAARPFDLAAGPLARATVVRLGDEEHAVFFTLHHIVTDGWSTGILVDEVSALYDACAAGRTPELADLPVQYADYAAWQRGWLAGEVLDAQVGWWREQLAGAPPVLELPTDRPRPAMVGNAGARRGFALPAELSDELRALSRGQGVTLFMTLLAAWQSLLARWSGQPDVSVGTPIAGRTRLETEGLIGFFVNTLVLRSDLSAAASFRELLAQVRETTLGAHAHQDVPFEKLVEELAPDRSLAHTPLFQVLFTLQNADSGELRLGDVRLESLGGGGGTSAKFDLSLAMGEGEDGIEGTISYRTELFDASTIERMIESFRLLLEAVVADSDASPLALPILADEERSRVVDGFNATAREYPAGATLHGLVAAQAARTPDAVALVFEGETVTYRELDARSNQLARHLRSLGVGAKTRVGVCAERSPELVVALLGVIKAGGAYVPVDPSYPAERIAYMLEDSAVPVVLTQARLADALPAHAARVVRLDADWAEIERESAEAVDVDADPSNLAYMIYTSGSTGRPKGAMNAHAGIVNRLLWMQDEYGLDADDVVLQKTPFSFDVSVWEFFWPLITGARLVLARPEGHRDPAYLAELIERERVTTLHFVPPMLQAFLDEASADRCASLRRVICSGEALPYELQERFFSILPEVGLHNLYGPTEAAVDVTYWACERGDARRIVPIGRPVANTRIHVLDAWMEPVPLGVPGELYIGGVQVGRGYHGRPALTAERFVPDPLSAEPGARLYRTGDRARYLADGAIEYLGRTDFQVKVRGFRIELGEVEAALLAHPAVREAVATVREDVPGDRRLVGYVVAGQGAPSDSASIRAALRLHLPEHMVPGVVMVMDALPLTPSGKVDRKALPAPDATVEVARYAAPSTPTEEILAGIWAEVLHVERVGVHDSFFDLGGHSLLATRVISRIRAAFATEIPLRAIFEAPTLGALAARIDHEVRAGSGTAVPPLVRVPRDAPAPLSFAQQRLWFLDQLQPGSAAYNVPSALRVRGALDLDALRRSLDELARRHEVLRTVFPAVDGEPVQVIQPAGAFPLEMVDLSAFAVEEREAELTRLAEQEAARPFDLAAGPLARATVVRLGDEEHAVFFTLHHIVTDGWSTGILVDEVSALYDACAAGRTPELADLPVQYADYAAWQRSWLAGEVLDAQVRWWREKLAGAPPVLELPTDRPRPAVIGNAGDRRGFVLPAELSDELRALSRDQGVTLFMTLLAAWQSLLARWSGQPDVSVGTPIAGRTRLETEGLIGFFVNTLVLRSDVGAAASFRELLAQVRETTLGAHAHQDVPFEKLVEELAPERSLAHTPLFQVLFTLQNADSGELRLGDDVRLESLGGGGGTSAKFDLSLAMGEGEDGIEGTISYRTELFDASTIERMIEGFRLLLEAVVADPGARPLALPVLGGADRERLATFNPAPTPAPAGARIHDLFLARAAETPAAVALVHGETRVSYGELERRSAAIARALRARGVGAETRVGVCLERTPELVAALLAVLRAGGTYVPLDPAYPAERLALMLEDSDARVVVTHTSLSGTLPSHAGDTLFVDGDLADDAGDADGAVDAANGAYLIYTSGSTGRPKGVQIEHRSAVEIIEWARALYPAAELEGVLASTSVCFDLSVYELFVPLALGTKVILADNALALPTLPARDEVTLVNTVPSAMAELVRQGGVPASVRVVNLAGEPLPRSLADAIYGGTAVKKLYNLYGPSEDTTYSTGVLVPRDPAQPVTIGRAIANTRAWVADGSGALAPVSVAGELCLAGAGLARGYLGRPALTAEKWVPDPFSGVPGARMYRTGDLARWRESGEMEYLGRIDRQVKVRGFRIEPGEVEEALKRHASVVEAAVVVREDVPGDRRLVGYVVAGEGSRADSASIRVALREHLPEHLVPGVVVVLEALPLSPNGKVDRRALPAPERGGTAAAVHVPPRDALELAVVRAWESLLDAREVGVHDDFFARGGHSLLAVRLVSRLERATGRRMRVAALFEGPTPARMAEALRRADPAAEPSPLVTLHPGGEGTPLFVVHAAGGSVLALAPLARALGADRPVHAFEARGLLPGEAPRATVEEMAAAYLDALRRAHPSGPYRLAGWSMGGLVAFEIARRLEAAGERVEQLALIDTHLPQSVRVARGALARLASFARHLEIPVERLELDAGQVAALPARGRLDALRRAAGAAGLAGAAMDADEFRRLYRVYTANLRAARRYRPAPVAGSLLLVRPEEGNVGTAGWDCLAHGGVELATAPGDHFTMIREPNALSLAGQLTTLTAWSSELA